MALVSLLSILLVPSVLAVMLVLVVGLPTLCKHATALPFLTDTKETTIMDFSILGGHHILSQLATRRLYCIVIVTQNTDWSACCTGWYTARETIQRTHSSVY